MMDHAENREPANRNLAKETLRESEERFRIFLEATREGVAMHDRFKIIAANPTCAAMFGYGIHEIIGRDVLELAAADARDAILDRILSGDDQPHKTTGLRKDGSSFPLELCTRVIPLRGSKIHMTFFRNLISLFPIEQKKANTKVRLDPLFDCTTEAYYLSDATGVFLDVNQAVCNLFGYKREEIIGKSFLKLNLLSTDQIRKAAKHLALNIFGKPTEPEEYLFHHEDGSQIPVEIKAIPVRINDKTLLFGIVRDISEKKKSDDVLRRAIGEIEILLEERRAEEKKAECARNNKRASSKPFRP